ARADPHVDGLPAELFDRGQPPGPAHEYAVGGEGDGLEEAVAVYGGSQFGDVAQLGAGSATNLDRGDGAFQLDEPRRRPHRDPPPRGFRLAGEAREMVSTRSSSRSSTGRLSPISSRSSTPRPAVVAA